MYEVHSPENQETYRFNKFGLHMETRNMATNKLLYNFAYSVSTSSGALVSISDSTGGKLSIVRNYAGQVESIENPQRQKFVLSMDRKRLLRSFSVDSNNTIHIDYYRSSELLKSRMDANGNGYLYEYDTNGRLVKAIMPTGEVISLVSDISINGAIVNVTRNKKEMSLLIQKNFLHKSSGHEVEILQRQSDKSFITESKWGHKVLTKTRPYILLQGENPGLAESFPVPSLERTEVGKEVVNQLEWNYYGTNKGRVGKKLEVNGESIFTVELDLRTGNQILSLDAQRTMVSVNRSQHSEIYSSVPAGVFPTIVQEYNAIGLPTRWAMGSLVETYSYDRMSRLKEVKSGNSPGSLQYIYSDSPGVWTDRPSKLVIPTGGGFGLDYDEMGALKSVTTPRGHIHRFVKQLALGTHILQYTPPWSTEPYIQQFDQNHLLTARIYPRNMGKIIYVYDNAEHLRAVIGGLSSIHYHYISGTALVKTVEVSDDSFHMKTRLRYHRGSVKEVSKQFRANGGLNNYSMEYQYDATGRLSTYKLNIDRQTELTSDIKFDIKTGKLKAVSDLRVTHRSFGMVILEDLSKKFIREKKFDEYGRFQTLNLIINGLPLFRVNIEYNANSEISLKSVYLNHQTTNEEMAYNANNQG